MTPKPMMQSVDATELETIQGGLLQFVVVFAASKLAIYAIDKITGRDNNAY